MSCPIRQSMTYLNDYCICYFAQLNLYLCRSSGFIFLLIGITARAFNESVFASSDVSTAYTEALQMFKSFSNVNVLYHLQFRSLDVRLLQTLSLGRYLVRVKFLLVRCISSCSPSQTNHSTKGSSKFSLINTCLHQFNICF